MRPYYTFCKNGAWIKAHDTFQAALSQARQWKASDPVARVTVETYDRDQSYPRALAIVPVEIPNLVPELTKLHDFDWLPALDALGVHQW